MATQAAPNPIMMNAQARAVVVGNGVKMVQQISSQQINPANQTVVNIAPRNVGLILGFIVEVVGTATNGATNTATRTGFGSANILRNVTFTDLNNVQRINTTGYHLALLNSARQGFGFGGAYAPNLPMGYGNNWSPFAAPATLAGGAAGTVQHTYYVPLAYSSQDLRGSIYAAVVNATMNLQLTLNNTPFVAATDPINAIYSGNANIGTWTGNITVNVYQVYLDQLPVQQGGAPYLPILDLNTIYDIKNTTQTGFAAGQDFPISYAPFRQFLSTMAVYDNGGTFNTGSDINTWALMAANSVNLFKFTPNIAALLARQTFMGDPPAGVYYFDHRDKPVDTISYGNMQLVLNPLTVNANAQLIVCYESFQNTNALGSAPALDA